MNRDGRQAFVLDVPVERDTGTTASYPGMWPLDRAMSIDRSQRRIGAPDKKLNQMVHELYDLTGKEIKIVEETYR